MKVLLLTDAASAHSRKWIRFLLEYGIDVEVLSMNHAHIEGVAVHTFRSKAYAKRKSNVEYNRGAVLLEILPQIKKIIRKIKPDILHAHYLSSYGLYGAISGFRPFVLSVWGSDIMEFPYRNRISSKITRYVLGKADVICASSQHLVLEIGKFTNKQIQLIYFGTDFDVFRPDITAGITKKYHIPDYSDDYRPFIFGTVKGLYPHYGISSLIEAAAIFAQKIDQDTAPKQNVWELWIGGDGDAKDELQALSRKLNISDNVRFLGRVEHEDLPNLLSLMDLFVVPSLRESFGVVAVEASACCLPVIVSDTGGLPETVHHEKTGFCVKPGCPQSLADKIYYLYTDKNLRQKMGKAARDYAIDKFCYKKNVRSMINIYRNIHHRN